MMLRSSELLDCVFMTNIKKLMLDLIKETGEDPNDVQCLYNTGFPPYIPNVDPTQKCLASDLPDGNLSVLICYSEKHRYRLVRKGKESEIKHSIRD